MTYYMVCSIRLESSTFIFQIRCGSYFYSSIFEGPYYVRIFQYYQCIAHCSVKATKQFQGNNVCPAHFQVNIYLVSLFSFSVLQKTIKKVESLLTWFNTRAFDNFNGTILWCRHLICISLIKKFFLLWLFLCSRVLNAESL